jgi:hypothetical protein
LGSFGAGTSRAANRHRLPLGSFGAGASGAARRPRLPLGSFGTGEIEGGQSSQTTIGFVWYGDIEGGQSSQTGRLPVIHSFPRVAKEPREAVLQDTIEDGASGFLVISDHSAVSGGAEV